MYHITLTQQQDFQFTAIPNGIELEEQAQEHLNGQQFMHLELQLIIVIYMLKPKQLTTHISEISSRDQQQSIQPLSALIILQV